MGDGFQLDARLAADSAPVAELELSSVRLMNDANYPWALLVPRRAGAVELIDLDAADQATLMMEIADLSRALKSVTRCDKLNVAALGNQVRQLHVHVIARFEGDPAWAGPVWGAARPKPYDAAARETLIADLREGLSVA